MKARTTARISCSALFLAVICGSAPTFAQPANGKIAAEALFEEGRRLAGEGNFAEACPKFESSQRVDSSPSTLLNLANCYEKLDRFASAWATYKEAASSASNAGRAELVTTAQRHAERVASKLSRLTITAAGAPSGLEIKRDGHVLSPGEVGTPIPVDKGKHTIEASAPGKKPWSGNIEITEIGATSTLAVPALDDAPLAPKASAVTSGTPGTERQSAREESGLGTTRVVALVLGGVGVVGVGLGTVFALTAKSKYNDSLGDCAPADVNRCTAAGASRRDDARGMGNLATVSFITGGVALAGGIAMWVVGAPKEGKTDAPRSGRAFAPTFSFSPAPGGAIMQGAF